METLTNDGRDSRAPKWQAALLCLFLLAVYNSNLRPASTFDSLPSRYLPFSILFDRNLRLDWVVDGGYPMGPLDKAYFLAQSGGHYTSAYPVATPIVITPLYIPPAFWISGYPPDDRRALLFLCAMTMEKICAGLMAALSAAILFLALARVAPLNFSLLIALVYGLASSTWSITSQALWSHGLTQLCFAVLVWLLLAEIDSLRVATLAGVVLGLAAANKLSNVLMAVAFLVYFARRGRGHFVRFLMPVGLFLGLVAAYNWSAFGNLAGGYIQLHSKSGQHGALGGFTGNILSGSAGLLLSPNRGMFVYMPWTAFALAGMVMAWRAESYPWARHAILGMLGIFLIHTAYGHWWGGAAFGPRYVADVLPLLAFFLLPLRPAITRQRLLAVVFAVLVTWSVGIQAVGAFYHDARWDITPVHIDEQPSRVWDVHDTQVGRSISQGPAYPGLYYGWKSWLSRHN